LFTSELKQKKTTTQHAKRNATKLS